MKKCVSVAILVTIVIIFSSCHSRPGESTSSAFELSGKLEGGGAGMYVYLDRLTPDGMIHLDSARIAKGGTFSFHTPGIIKGFYNVRLTHDDFATLILDSNEKVRLTGNIDNLGYSWAATGSPDSKRFKTLNSESIEYSAALDSLQSRAQTMATAMGGNQRRLDSLNLALEGPFDSIRALHQRFMIKFIKDNLTYFSAIAAIQQLSPDDFLSYYILLDSSLMATYPHSLYSKHFHDEVTTFRRTAAGAPAPEFTLPDAGGKMVRLSDLKGKTVLVHFWSSANRASLASLPPITRIYNKLMKNNFTVLAVSFDRDKDAWLNTIQHYKLNWLNVCDTAGSNSLLFKLYNVRFLPYDYLISTDGKIIDKDIQADDLEDVIRQAVK